jgi:hypothetical protein
MTAVRFRGPAAALGLAAWLAFLPAARAGLPVAPPPREVHPDGSRDPAPQAGSRENPLEVVERIVKNSQSVGDKLAQTDTGTETRGKQATILKDIDKLIDQQENPPPPMGGDSDDKKKQDKNDKNDKNDKSDESPKNDKNPKGGMDPKGDMNPQGGQNPMGGNSPPRGRKPRQGEQGSQPKNSGPPPTGKPPGGMAKGNPKSGKQAASAGGNPKGKIAPKATLPIDDAVVKEVWGHLPDRLRQQVSQYYKEEFMPKYAELLKQYYSSLANNPAGEKK